MSSRQKLAPDLSAGRRENAMQTPRASEGERRVAADQWDTDGWQILATEAEKVSFADAKPVYERLVTQFPPVGRFWRSYIEHLAREGSADPENVKALYERAVEAAPTSIDLWRSYVTFCTSLAVKVPGSKLEADALAVHEKALLACGLDLNANPLWSQYIDFLKNRTTLSDSQRRDALRRVYQRSVMTFTPFPSFLESLGLRAAANRAVPPHRIPFLFACLRMKKDSNHLSKLAKAQLPAPSERYSIRLFPYSLPMCRG